MSLPWITRKRMRPVAERDRDEVFVEYTKSICPVCKVVVDTQVNIRDDKVFCADAVASTASSRRWSMAARRPTWPRRGSTSQALSRRPYRGNSAFNPAAVAPLVTLAYGLSDRESRVTRLCMEGLSRRWLTPSPYRRTLSRPSQIDLRKSWRPEPQRAGRPDLPGALLAPLGRHR
jgi:hypothetical protein